MLTKGVGGAHAPLPLASPSPLNMLELFLKSTQNTVMFLLEEIQLCTMMTLNVISLRMIDAEG